MFEHLKHTVIALKRVRIGDLVLGGLAEGQIRQLSAREITGLLEQSNQKPPPGPLKAPQETT
jgi:16S rRNA U516 pseudouridylate synthase RsuA-like enzyme